MPFAVLRRAAYFALAQSRWCRWAERVDLGAAILAPLRNGSSRNHAIAWFDSDTSPMLASTTCADMMHVDRSARCASSLFDEFSINHDIILFGQTHDINKRIIDGFSNAFLVLV
ncbi:hypothetical protein [Robbsia sp. KACC 23696]|uniref:hypothetical protein n=1 Tax=Robbsia sp. KACC 23696 TaxID=3149231 RepID=UPI00325AAFBB